MFWLLFFSLLDVFGQINDPEPEWVRVGFNFSPGINFSRFSESTVMHPSLRITPMPAWAAGISWSADIAKRWAVEGNINFSTFGTRTRFNGYYPGNNVYEGIGITKTNHTVFSFPINLKYQTLKNSRQSKKYFKLGITIVNSPYGGENIVTKSNGLDFFGKKGFITEEISWKSKAFIAPTLNFGVGTEKHFKKGQMISAGVFFNKGFKAVEPWDFTLTYEGKTYKNRIINKATYLGIELKFFLPPIGYKSYKRDLEKFKENKMKE